MWKHKEEEGTRCQNGDAQCTSQTLSFKDTTNQAISLYLGLLNSM